jgi:hypothetical protein
MAIFSIKSAFKVNFSADFFLSINKEKIQKTA